MKTPNYISGLITIIIAGFFYAQTFGFPKLEGQLIGAEFMPRVYSGLLFVLGGILLVQAFRDKSAKESNENTMKYAVITMFVILLYLIMIPFLGFYISTILIVFGLLLFSKVTSKIILFAIPVGTSLFIFILFQKLLKVSIPLGSLFS